MFTADMQDSCLNPSVPQAKTDRRLMELGGEGRWVQAILPHLDSYVKQVIIAFTPGKHTNRIDLGSMYLLFISTL